MTELERVQRIEEAIYSLAKDSKRMVELLEQILEETKDIDHSLRL